MSHLTHARRAPMLTAALAATLALAACSGTSASGNNAPTDQLAVVATTTQLVDFAQQIGGDDIALTGLLPVGASAHHFDPSPKELLALGNADVLIVNGAGLETFIDSAIEASGFDGTLITAADGVELEDHEHADEGDEHAHDEHADDHAEDHAEEGSHDDHDHDDHEHDDHEHGGVNPHIWTSPRNASGMAAEVARGLAAADPDHANEYEQRSTDYAAKLAVLDEWITAQFERIPADERVLVSGHDSLHYYLEDYGIEFAGSIVPSFEDNAEPSAAEIDALVATIKERGAKAVFVESSMSPKLAQTIAKEAGVQVIDTESLYADSLGTEGSGAETYIGATVHNTQLILEAWGATPDPVPTELG